MRAPASWSRQKERGQNSQRDEAGALHILQSCHGHSQRPADRDRGVIMRVQSLRGVACRKGQCQILAVEESGLLQGINGDTFSPTSICAPRSKYLGAEERNVGPT